MVDNTNRLASHCGRIRVQLLTDPIEISILDPMIGQCAAELQLIRRDNGLSDLLWILDSHLSHLSHHWGHWGH